jgi:YVTN family beta-propeller protein
MENRSSTGLGFATLARERFTPMSRLIALAALATAMAAGRAGATPFAYVGAPVGNIKVIDTATDAIVATVPIGTQPYGVAVSPDGSRVYIVGNSGFIRVIDTATNTATQPGDPLPHTPHAVSVHPNGTRIYVSVASGIIRVIDSATYATIADIPGVTASGSLMAMNPTGTRLYVPNGNSGTVTVIDTTTNTVVTNITGMGWVFHAAVNPAGTKLYVGSENFPSAVYVIDTATNIITTTIPTASPLKAIAVNPAGTRVYAPVLSSMAVIDTATDTVLTTVSMGTECGFGINPEGGIAINPAGTKVYFHSSEGCGPAIRTFDTATNTLLGSIPLTYNNVSGLFIGPFCPGACSDGNPCTTDSCNQIGGCGYTNNTGPCGTDGNDCTDDVCDGAGACTHPNSSAGSSCTDGTFCNGADTCDGGGGCTNHVGDPCVAGAECARTCNEATDDCFDPATTGCTSDGNVCTDDHCNGLGACVNTANTAPCNDGLFCNGTDTCAGGICTHGGDPCTGGPECGDLCNEAMDNCFDPAGAQCASDGNPCSVDACDGSGACANTPGNGGTTCRSSTGQCDAAEACTGASITCPADLNQPDGTPCTDGDACTNPDVCTGGACTSGTAVVCPLCQTCDTVGGCLVGPRPGCKHPTRPLKASILFQDRTPDDLDQVKWKWSNGQATTFTELGDPLATDAYAFCVYDATSNLLVKMTAPAGGTCGTKPCWKQLGPAILPKGYKYKDLDGLPDDLDSLTLKAGLDGKAKVSLKGKGANVPMPTLGSLALPLTTQLQSGNGQCYEATTATPSVNTATLFKAKGD